MKPVSLLFEERLPRAVSAPQRSRRWRGVAFVCLLFLTTRVVTWTGAYYGALTLFRIENKVEPSFEKRMQEWARHPPPDDSPLARSARESLADFAPLCRFDGNHYRSIIERGYQYTPPPPGALPEQRAQNIAFFPLYPLLCQPLSRFFGPRAALVLVAHICALAAAILLYLWVRHRIDDPSARFAAAVTLCLPAACYYSFGYAESLTLLLTVAALWLIDRRAWLPAALICGLATATRPTALPIVGVYALAYWFNNSDTRRARLLKLVPLVIVGAAGLLAYAGYLTYRFDSPLVYAANFRAGWVTDEARANWLEYLTLARMWDQFKYFGRMIASLPVGLVNLASPLLWNVPTDLFILFLSLAGLLRVPRSFRPLLALGPLIFLQAYVASGGATFGIEPIARYLAVAVPAFVVLAAWATREWRPGLRHALLALLLFLQGAWAFRFGMVEWSG